MLFGLLMRPLSSTPARMIARSPSPLPTWSARRTHVHCITKLPNARLVRMAAYELLRAPSLAISRPLSTRNPASARLQNTGHTGAVSKPSAWVVNASPAAAAAATVSMAAASTHLLVRPAECVT